MFWSRNNGTDDTTTLYETITLYVPKGKVDAYKATDGWKNFKTILEMADASPITITAESKTVEYGETLPEYTFKSEGGELSGTPTITCETTSTSPAGTYPITVSQGTVENIHVTYVAGTLTITKAPLTVTAKSYTIKQGDPLPTFEAIYSGFKNDETSAVLSPQPTISCSATSASAPGTYDIIVSGASANNYEISYVNGTLTVSPTSYTITYIIDNEVYTTQLVDYGSTIVPPATDDKGNAITWSAHPTKMPAYDITIYGTTITGIEAIMANPQKARIYNLNGVRQHEPQKGLNIVKMSDGTVRKVMVK